MEKRNLRPLIRFIHWPESIRTIGIGLGRDGDALIVSIELVLGCLEFGVTWNGAEAEIERHLAWVMKHNMGEAGGKTYISEAAKGG